MVHQKHICLLVTEDDKNIIGFDDSVGASIKQRFKTVCGDSLIFSTYEVVRGHFPTVIDDFDGYLITGSHYGANDNLPWMLELEEFIRQVRATPSVRMFGICFGHQLIAKALGGRIGKNPCGSYLFSCGNVTISQEFSSKRYFQEPFGTTRDNFYIFQSHNDQVIQKPKDSVRAGWSPECANEVLSYGNNILTMQGHPEVSVDRMENLTIPLIRSKGLITEARAKVVYKELVNENCNELVTLITRFFQGM